MSNCRNERDDYLSLVKGVRSDLDRLRRKRIGELGLISQIDDELMITERYLETHPALPDQPGYLALCTYTADYADQIVALTNRSVADQAVISSGSYIAAGTASYWAESDHGPTTAYLNEIDALRSIHKGREEVYSALEQYDANMANKFASAWETLEASTYDGPRAAAFQMRETLTQFLHCFAPDEHVRSQSWWEPYDGKKGISRADRIRFIREKQVTETAPRPLVCDQLKALKRLIDALNKAHSHGPVEADYIKPKLYEAQELLRSILAFILSPIHWI